MGHYCPAASSSPFACPAGFFSGSTGNANLTACLECTPGFICPNASTAEPTEPCPPGFYCPAGTCMVHFLCVCVFLFFSSHACGGGNRSVFSCCGVSFLYLGTMLKEKITSELLDCPRWPDQRLVTADSLLTDRIYGHLNMYILLTQGTF